MEIGIRKRIMARIYTNKPVCVNTQNFQRISITDALPALLIIPFGISLAVAILLVEKLCKLLNCNRNLLLKI